MDGVLSARGLYRGGVPNGPFSYFARDGKTVDTIIVYSLVEMIRGDNLRTVAVRRDDGS